MNRLCVHLSAALILLVFACTCQAAEQFAVTPGGLEYRDLKVGTGTEALPGSTAVIHLVGWLEENGQPGKEIYNSRKERRPVSFVIGTDGVIQGWNQGVVGMRVGGTRMLKIPPELGYGEKGVDDVIPPNARMRFVIQLLEVK